MRGTIATTQAIPATLAAVIEKSMVRSFPQNRCLRKNDAAENGRGCQVDAAYLKVETRCRRRSRRCRANIDQRLWLRRFAPRSRRWLRRGLFSATGFQCLLTSMRPVRNPKNRNIEKLTAEMNDHHRSEFVHLFAPSRRSTKSS